MSIDEVDVECSGLLGESGHTHDVTTHHHEHLGAGIDDDILHVEAEALGGTILLGVGREGVLCLGNTDGEA